MGRIKGNPDLGGIGATIGFFIGFAAVSLFGVTAGKIKAVMDINPVLVGLLISAPALSGSLLRIPFAAWVDTTGGRKPFLVLLGLSIVGMAGLYFVLKSYYPNNLTMGIYPLLILLGVLCGCGIATFSVGIGQVSYWFPQNKQGTVLGLYAGVGNLAPGIFALILPFAMESLGLVTSYLAWLVFLVVGTFVYWAIGRNAWYFQLKEQGMGGEDAVREAKETYGQEIFPKGNITDSLKTSAKIWKTWALVALYFTSFGGFIALTAWFPTYWSVYFGRTIVIAGILTAVYSILASLIRVIGGQVSDIFGGERTAITAFFITMTAAIIMFFSQSFSLSIAGSIFLALGMGTANAAVFKLVPQEVPDAVGGAAGWVGGLGAFGGFVIPPIMGAFVNNGNHAGYAYGFVVFIVLAMISLSIAVLLKKMHRTN